VIPLLAVMSVNRADVAAGVLDPVWPESEGPTSCANHNSETSDTWPALMGILKTIEKN
jgi:hypothetical protein